MKLNFIVKQSALDVAEGGNSVCGQFNFVVNQFCRDVAFRKRLGDKLS